MNPDVQGLCPRATAQVQTRARLMMEVVELAEKNLEPVTVRKITKLLIDSLYLF